MSERSGPVSAIDPTVIADYLARTRWFGGKGRPFAVTDVRRLGEVSRSDDLDGPRVLIDLVELTYADVEPGAPDRHEHYQVPIAFYPDPQPRLEHAFLGWWEEPELGWVHAYDALHDKEAMACWLRSFDTASPAPAADRPYAEESGPEEGAGGLVFHRVPGHDLDVEAVSMLFTGEQSNSSVIFGEDSLMKVFRKVTPGTNPDILVHDVLTRAGSEHVAALYGWLEWTASEPGEVLHLAMLQQFLRTATDGWELAQTSVRDLFSEGDLHAHEVGGDFAGEATRLGEALAEVHRTLATEFPSERQDAAACGRLATAMIDRLDDALPVVPALAEHADRLRALYRRVAMLERLDVQQIHGDLHLGQTLRTSVGWKIVDFEGEPAKPLADRLLPDSRWRDVAGMLRSFDYAPRVGQRAAEEHDPDLSRQRAHRVAEWAHRNMNHFLVAYAGGPVTEEQQTLLDAYVADKAVYESVYETRNRPDWVSVPLAAIALLG